MAGRRVSRGTGGRAALATVAAAILAVGLLAPVADASTERPRQRVILRLASGQVDGSALLAERDGDLVADLHALDSIVADVPVDEVDALRDAAGVLEVAEDVGLQLVDSDPERSPTGADVSEGRTNPIRFVDDDFAKTDRGRSFDAFTVDEVASVIGASRAHDAGVTGAGVDIAVIDTGIAPVPGLGTVVNGPDLSFESQDPDRRYVDTNGHGTHLAGIVSGIAPDSRLVNVKVGADDGAVDVSQVIAAIDWVIQHRDDNGLDIRVLNLAYGTPNEQDYRLDPLAYAAEVAWRHGIVVVTAAGNGGAEHGGRVTNPAIDPYVLAIGASESHGTYTTSDDTVAAFSSRGDDERAIDLVAPGRSIVSLRVPGSHVDEEHPEGRHGTDGFRGSGTSQSAAVTAGAVALLLDEDPGLQPDQVKRLLTDTAKHLPRGGDAQGSGIIAVDKALRRSAPSMARAAQSWPTATGTGTLEGARGSSHVEMDGVVLTGEHDIFGEPWNGTSWSGTSWSGTSWSGGTWNGTSWSGTSWSGTSWSGTSWSGTSWSGTSWSGTSWSGTSWSGTSWSSAAAT